jgi:uncharacterized protein YbjT (DUF2867 family)
MVLVTGAGGKTGRAVIGALSSREVDVRAFVRSQQQASEIAVLGAAETVIGDMTDAVSFSRATEGATAVYHICPNMHPDEVAIGRAAVAAARAAGVQHFVYHSVLHPQVEAMPHHWHKLRVEELLLTSGLDITILQPAAYMQNILAGWRAIVEKGIFRVPYSVDARLGLVDLLDVAVAATVVLTEPSHRGATYELVGPANLTPSEVASALSRRLARPVRAEQLSLTEWQDGAIASGLSRYEVDGLLKMFRYYDKHGFVGSSWQLERLLSRPATDLAAFLARTAGAARNGGEG